MFQWFLRAMMLIFATECILKCNSTIFSLDYENRRIFNKSMIDQIWSIKTMSITYNAAVPTQNFVESYLLQPWENLSLSCSEFTNIGYKIRKDFVPCLWFQQQVVSFKTSTCQKITLAPTRFKMKVIVSISTDMQSFSVGSYKKVCLDFYLNVINREMQMHKQIHQEI